MAPTTSWTHAVEIGSFEKTWVPQDITVRPDATLTIAFSGWVCPSQAVQESENVYNVLKGDRYISLGGGNNNGAWTTEAIARVDSAIVAGVFDKYNGICYDIELGVGGMSSAFESSFQTAQRHGYKVMVTVSRSAPYAVPDKAVLMDTILRSHHVDFISPQLYTQGTETFVDMAVYGYPWSSFANGRPVFIPAITQASLYQSVIRNFEPHGVTPGGYIIYQAPN